LRRKVQWQCFERGRLPVAIGKKCWPISTGKKHHREGEGAFRRIGGKDAAISKALKMKASTREKGWEGTPRGKKGGLLWILMKRDAVLQTWGLVFMTASKRGKRACFRKGGRVFFKKKLFLGEGAESARKGGGRRS